MNAENIFLAKINAFKKKIWETNETCSFEELSCNLDDIIASLPTFDEAAYFQFLHIFFVQMSDKRLFEKTDFVNEVFRKLLNLYAYYLNNDSLAVCSVFVNSLLGNDSFCNVNDIQNLLTYLHRMNKIELPIFPIFENDECRDTLHEIFVQTKKIINENPYIVFYSMPELRERLEDCVAAAIDNYKNMQIVMHEDSLGIGALLLLSLLPDEIVENCRLTCIVPEGAVLRCRRWLEIPSNRVWLDKKSKYHREIKKTMKCIKEKTPKKSAALFYLSARKHRKFPLLPNLQSRRPTGFFLLIDCFEPKLPDCSFYKTAWADWDTPVFSHWNGSDRFVTLGCALFEYHTETAAMSLMDFYKSLRGVKKESEVFKMWKNTSVKEPRTASDFLIKADILCRAGEFEESFKLVKKYYEVKISAAYRICSSIFHHCNQPELRKKVSCFIEEKELFQRAFCAELHEIVDNAEHDEKNRWL